MVQPCDWDEVYERLLSADTGSRLSADDLERLAVAAYLTGHDEHCIQVWTRAQQAHRQRGEDERASRCAFWIGMLLALRGETAQANGWFSRAGRCVSGLDCVEQGYLMLPVGLAALSQGSMTDAQTAFSHAVGAAERFDDSDLAALARLGQGQCRVALGDITEGIALLDEVMVSVQAGEVTAIPAGIVYCAVVQVCHAIFDLRRAQEWTAALDDWCSVQPGLVPYRGQCLVHRSQLLQLRGAWPAAMAEAQRACQRLADPVGQPAIGEAHYQRAELHRLRGDVDQAERDYQVAGTWGRVPQPGMALLRLQQGNVDGAQATIRRVLAEPVSRLDRAHLLAAGVEILLVAGDVEAARTAAAELHALADAAGAAQLTAVSAYADGAVLLFEGDLVRAMSYLRRSWRIWQELEATFEAARVQILIGSACLQQGDDDSAAIELDAAREVFGRLGATPQLARLEELSGTAQTDNRPGGLTSREVEVLQLLAAGGSNAHMAAELVISPHTVARHVQNIFVKLAVTSRTAAAAFAFEHGLMPSGRDR